MSAAPADNRKAGRAMRLSWPTGRRDRVNELRGMTREQFDALPEQERREVLADLRDVIDAGDTRGFTGRVYGSRGQVEQRHTVTARDLLRRFTAEARPAPSAAVPVKDRYDAEVTRPGQIDDFLKNLDRAELTRLGAAKGWVTEQEAGKLKLAFLRKQLAGKAHGDMLARSDLVPPPAGAQARWEAIGEYEACVREAWRALAAVVDHPEATNFERTIDVAVGLVTGPGYLKEWRTQLTDALDVVEMEGACGDCVEGRCHWGGEASRQSIADAQAGREYRQWYGTATQHERDRVEALPDCRSCARTRARRP